MKHLHYIVVLGACLAGAPALAAAGEHQLTVTLPAHSQVQRTFDGHLTSSRDKVDVKSHRAVTDDMTLADGAWRVVRTQTAFTITPETPPFYDYHGPWWTATLANHPTTVFTAGPYLYPRTVENWSDIQSVLLARTNRTDSRESPTAIRNVLNSLDKTNATYLLLKEDVFLAHARERALTLNTPVTIDSEEAAPFGGGKLTYHTSVTLTRWDEAADTAEIDYGFAPDQPSMIAALRVLLPRLLGPQAPAAALDKALDTARVDNSTRCHFSASIATGLVRKADCKTSLQVHIMDFDDTRITDITISEALMK